MKTTTTKTIKPTTAKGRPTAPADGAAADRSTKKTPKPAAAKKATDAKSLSTQLLNVLRSPRRGSDSKRPLGTASVAYLVTDYFGLPNTRENRDRIVEAGFILKAAGLVYVTDSNQRSIGLLPVKP